MSSVATETTTTETTETRMSRTDAQKIVNQLNELQRVLGRTSNDNTKAKTNRAIARLVEQLTMGDRIAVRDPERAEYWGQWSLVLTEDEQAEDEARKREYMLQDMQRELDRAKSDYRRELNNRIERLQRELVLLDQDDVRGSSPYSYSGEHDLPILRERIEQLTKLVKYATTGQYSGW